MTTLDDEAAQPLQMLQPAILASSMVPGGHPHLYLRVVLSRQGRGEQANRT
jgi:hypothetical protein